VKEVKEGKAAEENGSRGVDDLIEEMERRLNKKNLLSKRSNLEKLNE